MSHDKNIDYVSDAKPTPRPGPFLAKVVSHLDPSYMGMLEVQLLRPVGNTPNEPSQLHTVRYMSPFYGVTSRASVSLADDDYNNTQKSYGMWMIPPDVDTTVMVIFIDGDPKRGYWIGCVPEDEGMNFMVPGIASTKYVADGDGSRVPVAEYNKDIDRQISEPTKVPKPRHPLADALESQGLLMDDIRGITTSSARREVPSAVFGISTPGPIDKRPGAKKGLVGKLRERMHAFVSRLGGSTFVMDDGDDKFIRKTKAGLGPPDYAAKEQGESGGDPTIPHNELVRIRTRTGHQILLHNSEDLIYITNSRGTAWIELTSNGKIDIYSKDSISVHTENDLNFTAARDINFTAGADINLNATGNANMTATKNTNINSAHHYETAGKIDMNGPVATKANKTTRIPQTEPWAGHENLDPLSVTPDKTKSAATAPAVAEPAFYKKYTTSTDTFEQVKPPTRTQ